MAVVVVKRSSPVRVLESTGEVSGGQTVDAGAGAGSNIGAEPIFALVSIVAVGIYWLFFVAQHVIPDLNPAPAVQLAEGVAAFALFYVAAQAIERVLEPIASMDPWKKKRQTTRDQALAAAASGDGTASAAATAQGALDQWRANRAVALWAIATILGMFASAKLGLYFVSALVEVDPNVHLDVLVTGLAIGGGTKPLHDLITRVQATANTATDQPVTV
jgi:hypothetical protein